MPFDNPAGLLALLALVPFILLYLIRPKPMDKVIPSLMFLIKEKKRFKENAFLQRLVRNLLFFLQLFIILALAISVAAPYMMVPYESVFGNTVIVLDVSGSMQTKDGLITRFDRAVSKAKEYLIGRVSIVLVESLPIIVLENGNKDSALGILTKLEPKATGTNIGDAMLTASSILEGKHGRIVVISDFGDTDGPDIFVAKRVITSKGLDVIFEDVSKEAKNMGIVNLEVKKTGIKAYIKNFNDKEEQFVLTLEQDGKLVAKSNPIDMLGNSVEVMQFDDTPPGLSELKLDYEDDLKLDNIAYISAPAKKRINVLLVTDLKTSNLISALEASKDINLEMKYFTPERSVLTSYDVVIMDKFKYVPGTFNDLSYYVKNGGNVILTAQDDLKDRDLNDIGLVDFSTLVDQPSHVCVDIFNQFTSQFQEDRCFTSTSLYFKGTAKEDVIVIASASDGSPIIALKQLKEGAIVYYGIFDDNSDFETLPSYPIFWNDLMNSLVQTEDIRDYNFRTGSILDVDMQTIKTPSKKIKASTIFFDEAGIYEFNNKKIAVNMLDEKESNIVEENELEKNEKGLASGETSNKDYKLFLEIFFLIAAFIVLAFEFYYIKRRGDV
jgi:hypothetical protein